MSPKKIYLPHQCYFITTNVIGMKRIFGELKNGLYTPNDKLCQILIDVLNYTRERLNFFVHGFAIMPDHVHFILSTAGDKSPATREIERNHASRVYVTQKIERYRASRVYVTQKIERYRASRVGGDSSPQAAKNISQIMHAIKGRSARLINRAVHNSGKFWQGDFYEHGIRNQNDFEEKINYVHYNPVRAKLINNPANFKYSSYGNYYRSGGSVITINDFEL